MWRFYENLEIYTSRDLLFKAPAPLSRHEILTAFFQKVVLAMEDSETESSDQGSGQVSLFDQ